MHSLYQPVLDIVREAAETQILPFFRTLEDKDIQEKSPGDLVTVADRGSEIFLSEKLATLLPEASVIGEEAVAANASLMDNIGADAAWIIDPIDGTGNFAAGRAPFGILIALAEAGETVAGWLYDPLTQRICHAHFGHGAYIDGEKIVARESGEDMPIAALSTLFLEEEGRKKVIRKAEGHFRLVDIPRCAAEQYPRLVLGTNDVSIFERTLPWDHAAGILFLNEAGGKAARADDSPYKVADQRTGLIGAASPRLWDKAARILSN